MSKDKLMSQSSLCLVDKNAYVMKLNELMLFEDLEGSPPVVTKELKRFRTYDQVIAPVMFNTQDRK